MFTITAERPGDAAAIESLLDRAFGVDRHRKTAYRYRRAVAPVTELSLIAHDAADDSAAGLVGSIRYWPVAVGAVVPALLLGPLAVHPDRHGEGIGRALMHRSMAMAGAAGHRLALLVGDVAYYGQFGFRPAAPFGFEMPDEAPHRLLVSELAPGGMDGVAGAVTPAAAVPVRRGDACCTARLPG